MKTLRWLVGLLILIVVVMFCFGFAGFAYWYGVSQVHVGVPVCAQSAPAVCPNTPVEKQPAVADFGPEMAFPHKVNGPAIAELWNQNTGYCALVRINDGESLDWPYSGAWWQASGQDVLVTRWPHHVAEYQGKSGSSNCQILPSAGDVPAQ